MSIAVNAFSLSAPPVYPGAGSAEGRPVPTAITKINRVNTGQGESLFLSVDAGGETVRALGRPKELAERLEASGYDIPASESDSLTCN